MGARTYESVERQAVLAVENMRRVLHGQTAHAQAHTLEPQPGPERTRLPCISPRGARHRSRRVPSGARQESDRPICWSPTPAASRGAFPSQLSPTGRSEAVAPENPSQLGPAPILGGMSRRR